MSERPTRVKRYDLESTTECGEPRQEMQERDNGDWVLFDDVETALAPPEMPEPDPSEALLISFTRAADTLDSEHAARIAAEKRVNELRSIRDLLISALMKATGAEEEAVRAAPMGCAVAAEAHVAALTATVSNREQQIHDANLMTNRQAQQVDALTEWAEQAAQAERERFAAWLDWVIRRVTTNEGGESEFSGEMKNYRDNLRARSSE